MKKILLLTVFYFITCEVYSQNYGSGAALQNYIDANIVPGGAIRAATVNNIFTGTVKRLPGIIQDTASVTAPKHGYLYFQRKDSSIYVYDTIGFARWRRGLNLSASGDLQSVLSSGNTASNINIFLNDGSTGLGSYQPNYISLQGPLSSVTGYALLDLARGSGNNVGGIYFNTRSHNHRWAMGTLPLTTSIYTNNFVLYRDWGIANDLIYSVDSGTGITTYSRQVRYAANYGSLFNSRTLVDKGYVDSAISAGGGGSMVYPGAGIPISTGSAWGTSVTGMANQLLRRNAANTAYEFFTPSYLTSTPTLQQVTDAGFSTNDQLLSSHVSGFTLNANDATIRAMLGKTSSNGSGFLSLINSTSSDWEGRLFSQQIGNNVDWYLPDTGNPSDTIATLADVRSGGGGGGTVTSVTTTDNNLNVATGTTTPVITTKKAVQSLTDGATITWNMANGYNATVTIAGNRTLAISNAQAGQYGTLKIVQDATGSRTITLPAGSKVINGGSGAVTLSIAASSIDILTFFYDGTNYFWTIGKNYN